MRRQWHSTMDARVNIADDPSTSDKYLVKFAPVTTAGVFAPGGLHAGLCARISSLLMHYMLNLLANVVI